MNGEEFVADPIIARCQILRDSRCPLESGEDSVNTPNTIVECARD